MPSISLGTPGMLTKIFSFFSNHIPGAVPLLFCITVQTSGTSACFMLICVSGLLKIFSKRYFTFCNATSFTIILPLKYLHSKGFVISSAVGPSPPVIKIISECELSSLSAMRISFSLSPTATRRFTKMPALFNSCAMYALLVSITCPIKSSSPIVMIDALIILLNDLF